jgi:hypothetical protein
MEITITKKSNGIYDYAVLDARNIKDKYDTDLLNKLVEVVNNFNKEEIEKA